MTLKAVILTGGRSRRFGGVHKPGVAVGGVSVLARAVSAVRALDPAAEVWVAGPLDGLDTAARPTVRPVVESPPFAGPLAGLAAAVAAMAPAPDSPPSTADARGSTVLVLAGDVPFLDPADLARLVDASARSDSPSGCTDASGRFQPLFAAWPEQQLRERLQDIGDVENKPVRLLWDGVEPVLAPVSPASTEDFDTPEDYRRITGSSSPSQS